MARAKQVRRRRSPEEARAEILAAAERVLSTLGPDKAGLKAVATEAGVSHALVTHYFGTYEGLVGEVLAQRIEKARGQALEVLAGPDWSPEAAPLLDVVAALTRDPSYVRLITWALLSGRGCDVVPFRPEGFELIVEGLYEHRKRRAKKKLGPDAKEELKLNVLVSLTAMYGYALGRNAFAEVLGEKADADLDRRFQRHLEGMITSFLDARDGLLAPTSKR